MMNINKNTIGWVLYDFANSSYHLLLPTILMPLLFREYYAAEYSNSDFIWSITISIPVLLAGIIAPFIGALSDYLNSRLTFLYITATISIIFALFIGLSSEYSLIEVSILFILSYLFFNISLGLYDSILPMLNKSKIGLISGIGWGIGYLGGIISLVFVYPLLKDAKLPDNIASYNYSILIVVIFFIIFCSVSFLFLKNFKYTQPLNEISQGKKNLLNIAFSRVSLTIKNWKKNKNIFKILVSYYLANDGLTTLMFFTTIYASGTLNFDNTQILLLFVIVQLIGIPATIFGGFLADKYGNKIILYCSLIIWIFLSIAYAFGSGIYTFYLIALFTGIVIGTTPAIYRSLLASVIPTSKSAEIFGFNSFASRVSAIIGPLLFGLISYLTQSQRYAMLSLVLFFIAAYIILYNVDCNEKKDYELL